MAPLARLGGRCRRKRSDWGSRRIATGSRVRRLGKDIVNETGIYLIAGAAVLTCLVVVQLISLVGHKWHKSFLSTVILGEDGRTSTSKTFILMWTLLVSWALIALLIAGELIHTHGCVTPSDLTKAAEACSKKKGHDVGLLQVGWLHFLHTGLSGSYLVLLGVPAAAGVAAKGITQREASGTGFKTPNANPGRNPFARVAEIFSADDGTTDLGDFQYMIFNLVTAVYFVVQFVHPDGTGLPTMPDTLLGLTSVSAGLYVGKKAVSRSQLAVTGVFPQPVQANMRFTIVGEGLTAEPTSPTNVPPQVSVDGVAVDIVAIDGTSIVAVLPGALGGGGATCLRHLQVKNPYDGITPSFDIQCR